MLLVVPLAAASGYRREGWELAASRGERTRCDWRLIHRRHRSRVMPEPFSYDVVEYPSAPLPQIHPGQLFSVARLYGLDPAPVERCRYLEIGCGDGAHLIACAYGIPNATFVGIALSSAAIDRGNRVIAELGLPNVRLCAADLTQWEPPARRFDYVVAHGLYSWVPALARDALLGLVARCLPPSGVGYVSYNAYPGCF